MHLSDSVQLFVSPSVMLCRNVIPPYIKKNKDRNRYLDTLNTYVHLFSFLTATSIGQGSIRCILLGKRGQEWFCVSKASARSWLASTEEMSSWAEKLDC